MNHFTKVVRRSEPLLCCLSDKTFLDNVGIFSGKFSGTRTSKKLGISRNTLESKVDILLNSSKHFIDIYWPVEVVRIPVDHLYRK